MKAAETRQNALVAALPDGERIELVRQMAPVELPARTDILRNGAGDAVFFPASGLVSVISVGADGSGVECAALGAEGWIGAWAFGGTLPGSVEVTQQIGGAALRMTSEAFQRALGAMPAFAALVWQFSGVLLAQAVQTAACNRFHDARARCARSLLFTSDRIGSLELPLTQESLAQMLGSGRSGVTSIVTTLDELGLVTHGRGVVVITDVAGLRDIACECYEALREVYAQYTALLMRPGDRPEAGDARRPASPGDAPYRA